LCCVAVPEPVSGCLARRWACLVRGCPGLLALRGEPLQLDVVKRFGCISLREQGSVIQQGVQPKRAPERLAVAVEGHSSQETLARGAQGTAKGTWFQIGSVGCPRFT